MTTLIRKTESTLQWNMRSYTQYTMNDEGKSGNCGTDVSNSKNTPLKSWQGGLSPVSMSESTKSNAGADVYMMEHLLGILGLQQFSVWNLLIQLWLVLGAPGSGGSRSRSSDRESSMSKESVNRDFSLTEPVSEAGACITRTNCLSARFHVHTLI